MASAMHPLNSHIWTRKREESRVTCSSRVFIYYIPRTRRATVSVWHWLDGWLVVRLMRAPRRATGGSGDDEWEAPHGRTGLLIAHGAPHNRITTTITLRPSNLHYFSLSIECCTFFRMTVSPTRWFSASDNGRDSGTGTSTAYTTPKVT